MSLKILIIEDEEMIADIISRGLTRAGYQCECVYDGTDAAGLLEEKRYDLILLDIMLPGVVGYELMEYIKNLGIPVIFITAKARLEDKIKGFKLGADDYITKPFELAELTARVEAVLKRYYKTQSRISVAGMEIDTLSRTVKKNGRLVELTAKEYDLFLVFLRNRNIALYRERIYEEVWGGEYDPDSRTVDIHVQRLKRKMGLEDYIISVRGIGYRFEVSET
ncbi:response regulator transcription factor [Enterocloster sp. OA11]|mgnify:CR=1 FL=1|jgi:two-component system alkaline phosphatase synthesis response regulator PhoP|uniref:response regulator transcription factor n=1 Tax=Clostridium sp. 1001283B150225_161107_B6 TaxID=2787141 RepID=UPI002ED2B3CC